MALVKDLEEALQIKISLESDEPPWTALYACRAAERRRAEVRKVIENHAPLSPMEAGIALYALDEARNGYNIDTFTVPSKWETKTFAELDELVDEEDAERDGDNDLSDNYLVVQSLIRPC